MRFLAISLGLLVSAAAEDRFDLEIQPLLEQFCFECHGDGASKGDLALDDWNSRQQLLEDHEAWRAVDLHLRSHTMPPSDEPKPGLEQRDQIRSWIDEVVFYVDPKNPDPGPLVIRRLNREEYNNVIRDVLRLDSRPADAFPPDDATHGFDTVGAGLTISPLLTEKLVTAAADLAEQATRVTPRQSITAGLRRDEIQAFGEHERVDGVTISRSDKTRIGIARPTVPGLYRVFVRAAADDSGGLLEVLDGDQKIGNLSPKGTWKGKRQFWEADNLVVELRADSEIFVRLAKPGLAAIERLGVQGPLAPAPAERSAFLDSIFSPEQLLAVPSLRLGGEDFVLGEGKSSLDTGKSWFATRGFRHVPLATEKAGRYRFRVQAGAQQAGEELVKLELRLGEQSLGVAEVKAKGQTPQWIEIEAECDPGVHELQVWFANGAEDDGKPTKWPDGGQRWLWVHQMEIAGPLDTPLVGTDEITNALVEIGRRLWRRPLNDSEIERIKDSDLRSGLESLLVSPRFLFLNAEAEDSGNGKVDEFTLASRLSFYLWSSAPDDELLNLAEQGQLRKNLDTQLDRMTADPKFAAFTQNFVGQWLQLRDLDLVEGADKQLLTDMRRETELFFADSLDKPISHLLRADYAFVNSKLANHYGFEVAEGAGFERVESNRGGLLRQASLLTLTSHPTRTSPVKRGQFVLEKILGAPPPPAPADVPALADAEDPEATAGTLRQQLEAHRDNPKCSACHAYFDPVGFAFEGYDRLGRWRGESFDVSGQLVTGEKFDGAGGLSKLLADQFEEEFARAFAEQLLIYALGRGLEFTDKISIEQILANAPERKLRSLILGVCKTAAFQGIRSETQARSPAAFRQ